MINNNNGISVFIGGKKEIKLSIGFIGD